jgi:hypothetical protein
MHKGTQGKPTPVHSKLLSRDDDPGITFLNRALAVILPVPATLANAIDLEGVARSLVAMLAADLLLKMINFG